MASIVFFFVFFLYNNSIEIKGKQYQNAINYFIIHISVLIIVVKYMLFSLEIPNIMEVKLSYVDIILYAG